jgi:hypothetical protein
MKSEQILQKSANKNMVQWNQKDFQKTHPKLYKTIIEAINEAINYTRCSTEMPVEDAKLLYGLIPEWAKDAPSGLDPSLYGTLTQEGDQAIVNKVKAILKKAIT